VRSGGVGWLPDRADGGAASAGEQSRLAELLAFDTFDGFSAKDSQASFIARIGEALRRAGLGQGAAVLGLNFAACRR